MSPEERPQAEGWEGDGRVDETRPDGTPAEQPPTRAVEISEPRPQQRSSEDGETFKIRSLYSAIVDHQADAKGWVGRDELLWLREWADRFIREFQIKTRDAAFLPLPLIKIEPLNIKTLVTFRAGRDGYAIAGTIVVNQKRLEHGVPHATLIAQLLVALMRAWQLERCNDDLFDTESRARFRQLGLTVSKAGITIEGGGHFWKLLDEAKVKVAPGRVPMAKLDGRSTLELWSCRCQKARVGVSDFAARCRRWCGEDFRPGNHVVKNPSPEKRARRRAAAKQAVAVAAARAAQPGTDGLSKPGL